MEFTIAETTIKCSDDIYSDTIKIKSALKEYTVHYKNDSIQELINNIYNNGDLIFIDENVYNLSPTSFNNKNFTLFTALEDTKNMESVLNLVDILYNNNFTRKNKLIVIGGGITQDVGGFAAGIYKRGIMWVYIPTTILAMTDSCIGSKVSVNRKSKNMLGLFIAPNDIYISNVFFNSLKDDDIISGLCEALKLSLIGGDNTYKMFIDLYYKKDYTSIIKLASFIKKQIIELDEFENCERKVLNLGHSIGHAIESTSNYYIPHGIAIMIGILIKNKLFNENKYDDLNKFILDIVNPKFFKIIFNFDIFMKHLLADKKNNGDNICFILLQNYGDTKIIYKPKHEIEDSLKNIINSLFIFDY